MSEPAALRITRLTETNFKRITAADIQPGRRTLVVLRGPNEQGKTSAIDGLIAALKGKKADPDVPVHAGADAAIVDITLSDSLRERYRIQASWKDGRRWLNVQQIGEDGIPGKITAGQTYLDSLVSDLSFDPLVFARAGTDASGRKLQARMLCGAIGRPELLEQAEARKAAVADRRKALNQKSAGLKAELCNGSADPAPGETLHEVTADGVTARLDAAEKHNAARRELQARVNKHRGDASSAFEQIRSIDAQIKALQDRREQWGSYQDTASRAAETAQAELDALPAEVSTTEITAALAQVTADNERARRQKASRAKAEELRQLDASIQELTDQLRDIDEEVEAAIAGSDLGQAVPGLSYVAGELKHNGVPLAQASGMRRLEISALIGMAANPALRIMTIDEGDQLDDASLARLIELAKERDFQVWMTAIRAGNECDSETHIVPVLDGRAVDGRGKGQECPSGPASLPTPAVTPVAANIGDEL